MKFSTFAINTASMPLLFAFSASMHYERAARLQHLKSRRLQQGRRQNKLSKLWHKRAPAPDVSLVATSKFGAIPKRLRAGLVFCSNH
jgi:hypothetical protein